MFGLSFNEVLQYVFLALGFFVLAARGLLWDWYLRLLFEFGILQRFEDPPPDAPPFLWDVVRILIGAGLIVAGFYNQEILRFIL